MPWNKGRNARAPHKGYFRHQCEYVVAATNGAVAKRDDDGPFDGCLSVPLNYREKNHPCAKPAALLDELLRATPPGGTILDPFSGGGSTLAAAVRSRRQAIGFELMPEFCEASVELVSQAKRARVAA